MDKIIKLIVERSGGSMSKIKLEEFMEQINHSFIFTPWNHWLGVKILKNPLDLMILQEIIFEKRPETIIECGTAWGGSAYFMAHMLDLMQINGKILTIDNKEFIPFPHPDKGSMEMSGEIIEIEYSIFQPKPQHPKINYIKSDCLSAKLPKVGSKTMVILDCDHSADHVERELERFCRYVTVGQYIVVEDTDTPDKKHGPAEAVKRFLRKNRNFIVDKSREKYEISSNLGGYLLRVS